MGAAFADAALTAFDGATSSSDESEASSDDEEAFLVEETTSETAFAALGAAFSSDDESESEESEESESESAFLGGAGVFFGEGFGAATFGADLVGGFTSSSLSLESDDVEGGLVAFTTWAALGFSSSEELSLLSSEGDGSFTFLAAWRTAMRKRSSTMANTFSAPFYHWFQPWLVEQMIWTVWRKTSSPLNAENN